MNTHVAHDQAAPAAPTIVDADIRADLQDAHASFVEALGDPGTWWTGAERVAIVDEARRAMEHAQRPPWEAPSTITGMIGDGHPLPLWAIDAVWRITNHPGTTTADWYASIIEQSDADLTDRDGARSYVELVAVVAPMNAIDRFADVMGLARLPLPAPVAGAPSRHAPESSVQRHWVPTVNMAGANVFKALSAVPAASAAMRPVSASHYVPEDAIVGDLTWCRDTLSRAQIELVAAATSMANECFY